MAKTISSRLPDYCRTYGITHVIVNIGTNKYEHQYIHHFNWLFRHFYKMYDDDEITGLINMPKDNDIEIIQIIELMYSFPISIHDFVTIAISVYETYDYFKTSKKVTDFITKIKTIFLLIKNRYINVRQLNFFIINICSFMNNIKSNYLLSCEIINEHLHKMRTIHHKLNIDIKIFNKKYHNAIEKLEKYKIEKIEFIKEQFKQTSKHIEYALEECDTTIKLLSYIEHSDKYDMMFDNISHKLLNNVQKYNYCVSNVPAIKFKNIFKFTYGVYNFPTDTPDHRTMGISDIQILFRKHFYKFSKLCIDGKYIYDLSKFNPCLFEQFNYDMNKYEKNILYNLKKDNILNILKLYNRTLHNSMSST
jgi:hypothetical protein